MKLSRYAPALAIGALLLSMQSDRTSAQQTQSSPPQDTQAIIQAIISTPAQPASEAPKSGTFYSAQFGDKWPPLPADILNLDFWDLGEGLFIYNDTNIDYNTLQNKTSEDASRSVRGPEMMVNTARSVKGSITMDSPPSPPGGGEGGGGGGGPLTPDYSYSTNELWLEILEPGTNAYNADTNSATVLLHGTIPDVEYVLFSATNLNAATTGTVWTAWAIEQNLIGAENTNVTPTTVSMIGRPMLYLRALAYTLDDDGDGLPSWWETKYSTAAFPLNPTNADTGNTGIPDGYKMDSAGDGWNNLQKFQMGIPPNVWATPPTPTGLSVVTTNSGTNASLSWNASPGPVLSYSIYKDGLLLTNVSPSQTSFTDTFYQPGDSYQFQADYSGGNSALGIADNPQIAPEYTTDAYIVRGPQGRLYLAASAVPPNVSSIRIGVGMNSSGIGLGADAPYPIPYTFSSFWQASQDFGDLFTNIFDVPVTNLINGVYEIPTGDVPAFYGAFFYSQAVGADGRLGNPSEEQYLSNWESGNVPFLDGTTEIQQNVSFLLRAATQTQPFSFYDQVPGFAPFYPTPQRTNYVFAGFHGFQDLNFSALQMNEFEPFEENYFYRNFAYLTDPDDAHGNLLTGAYSYRDIAIGIGVDTPMFLFPTHSYVVNSNQASIPAILPGATTAKWLFYAFLYNATNGADIGLFPDTNPNLADVVSGFQNLFGLSLKSVEYPSSSTDVNAFTTASAGTSITNDYSGNYFFEMDQPVLTNVAYYFARPGIDPLPGEDAFSNTNATASPIIIPFGMPFQITAWAKQAISNGYSGKFAYPEQYFDHAYEIDTNGVVTTNTTGILSPYGEFFPTEPGPTALVTMPDGATGQRGTGVVWVIKLQLDVNHDGTMDQTFSGPDNTTHNRPFQFWLNNDYDREHAVGSDREQDDLAGDERDAASPYTGKPAPDSEYRDKLGERVIPSQRDLEDFARLWICGITTNLLALLPPGTTGELSWGDKGNPNTNNPTIDLFGAAVDPSFPNRNGSDAYLTNFLDAMYQTNSYHGSTIGSRLGPGDALPFMSNGWANPLLVWCGVTNGAGTLTVTISQGGTNTLAQISAYIELKDIKQMYERWTVGDAPSVSVAPSNLPYLAAEGLSTPFQYDPPTGTNTLYILQVHDYDLPTWKKDRFAETTFKRLYWQGYQGRFGLFRWPGVYNGILRPLDDSEFNAWRSGAGLMNLLTNLEAQYPGNVFLVAHGYGTIVAGEALRLAGTNQPVNTYIAMQGAVPTHAYDPYPTNRPLNSTGINLDSGTPNRYLYYYTNGLPWYFSRAAGAGIYINYFNTNDYLLTGAWRRTQDEKPDIGYGWDGTNFFRGFPLSYSLLLFPTNTYEIFAYCDEARCEAIGAQPNLGGQFNTSFQVNLAAPLYSFSAEQKDHSAQFLSDCADRWPFWDAVLKSMSLKR
jgi:hypothetical protein